MSKTEQKVRYGIGSAASLAAIFAPLRYKWQGILAAVASDTVRSGVFGISPAKRILHT